MPSIFLAFTIIARPDAAKPEFKDGQAQVVAAYFPGLPLVASDSLRGAQVAIVVPSGFRMPATDPAGDGASGCPAA